MEGIIFETSYGRLIFAFTDCDYEEKMCDYKTMKKYAKDNYNKNYQDVFFGAFCCNDIYHCVEPIDAIKVTSKTSNKTYNEFIEQIKKEYLK